MPIANCFIKKELHLDSEVVDDIIMRWSKEINAPVKDISLNFIQMNESFGRKFDILVNLYLPSLWSKDEVKNIQLSLAKHLSQHLKINRSDIFLITQIIESGNVVEEGEIIQW